MESFALLHVVLNSSSIVQTTHLSFCLPIHLFFEEWGLDKSNVASAWDNKGDIIIGNDVWIGYEAVILAGVKIGDGAIIGARAVVTKDVEPYTIVAGTPAKPIRKRFDMKIVEILENLQWWNWSPQHIKKAILYIQAGDIEGLKKIKP